jgi:hypothetical protein
MQLIYDRLSKMFTLENPEADEDEDEVVFLGPFSHALSMLRSTKYGFTESQAREGVLQAFLNSGFSVDMDIVKKIS